MSLSHTRRRPRCAFANEEAVTSAVIDRAGTAKPLGLREALNLLMPAFDPSRAGALYQRMARQGTAAVPTLGSSLHAELEALVAPGYRADLVILDANPLERITHTRGIAWVVLDGRRVLNARELAGLLEQAAARWAGNREHR